MFGSIGFVYVCCEFGEKLSDAFEEIDSAIMQLDWYKFPAKFGKMLLMLIAGAQEPAKLRVFGSISCSREDFKNVR